MPFPFTVAQPVIIVSTHVWKVSATGVGRLLDRLVAIIRWPFFF